jgi:hypothetical protein
MPDVTQIVSRIESGDPSAAEQLLPLVYDELRKRAATRLAHEKHGQTLQATALGYRHGDLFQRGALYRAGQYDRAAQRLEQSIDVYSGNPPPPPGAATINYQRLFLAMTHWR